MATQAELTLLLKAKDQASGQIDKVKGKLGGLGGLAGKALKVGLLAGAGGALALGAGLFKLGADFDKAFDKIRIGTGETGDTLDTLKGDFKAVFKAIPTDMESASDAITQFNTLTGATGPALQSMAKNALESARLLGEDSAALIAKAGKAFNVFEVSAEDSAAVLDAVFTASQKSNVPMTQLLGTLQTYGPVLKNLGFGIEQSTAFFASLEKAGIDVSRVMPGLNAFMRKLSDEGVTDLSAALDEQIEKIKGAKTESEALNLATQAFGAEGAQRLSVAIRTGALDLDEFTKSLVNSEGAILDTAKETESIGEKFTRFKNTLIVGVQPAASAVFDGLGKLADLIATKVVPAIGVFINLFKGGFGGEGVTSKGFHGQIERLGILVKKVIEKAIPIIEAFRDGFIKFAKDALPHILTFGETLFELARDILPILVEAAGSLLRGFRQVFEGFIEPVVIPILLKIAKVIRDNKLVILGIVGVILLIVAPWLLVVAAIVLVLAKWDEIKAVFTTVIPAAIDSVISKIEELPIIGAIFTHTMNTIKIIVTTVFELIKNRIETVINAIQAIIKIVLALIKGDFGAAWEAIKELVSVLINGIKTEIGIVLDALKDLIFSQLELILAIFSDAWNLIKDTVIDLMTDLKDDVVGIVTGLKDKVVETVTELKDRLVRGFTNIWNKAVEIFDFLRTDVQTTIANTRDDVVATILGIPGAIGGLLKLLVQKGKDLIKGFVTGYLDAWKDVINFFLNVGAKVKGAIGDLAFVLFNAGWDLLSGLWTGIKARAIGLFNDLKNLANEIVGALKEPWKLLSPSKVTREMGRDLIRGLVAGVNAEAPTFLEAMGGISGVLATLKPAFQAGGISGVLAAGKSATIGAISGTPTISGPVSISETPTISGPVSISAGFAEAIKDALRGMVVELDGEVVGRIIDSRIGARSELLMRGG